MTHGSVGLNSLVTLKVLLEEVDDPMAELIAEESFTNDVDRGVFVAPPV